MSTLSKRATPGQALVLRMVEGAVRNASHAHPDYNIPENFARSVAKRAAGTLTAGWPEVLAARSASSDVAASPTLGESHGREANGLSRRRSVSRSSVQRGAVKTRDRRSPLKKLWKQCAYLAGAAKRAGNEERRQALIEVLRIIAAAQKAGVQRRAALLS